jgi:hypothetical protein
MLGLGVGEVIIRKPPTGTVPIVIMWAETHTPQEFRRTALLPPRPLSEYPSGGRPALNRLPGAFKWALRSGAGQHSWHG